MFAGRFREAGWGCGSNCGAGAFIDLSTGRVYPPPLSSKGEGWERWMYCGTMFEGNGFEYRLNSRLIVARCGWNPDKSNRNHPDVYYFVWEGDGFHALKHVRAPEQKW